MSDGTGRVFLFLQGPHGPFFRRLAGALKQTGAEVQRVAFNTSDAGEWRGAGLLHRFNAPTETLGPWIEALIEREGITDLVLYGDARPVHRIAIGVARDLGLRTHCLEEGYIRPAWITYEREGTNGNSRLMSISLPRMAQSLGSGSEPEENAPAIWGAYRQHLLYSALYYARLLVPSLAHAKVDRHRESPWRESARYWLRTGLSPWIRINRGFKQWRLLRSTRTFHLVLLQLSFDASMRVHSDYSSTAAFIEEVVDAFAEGAAHDDYLVFKAHPFEDGRERLGQVIRDVAYDLGVSERVIFIDGGKKLAALLDRARSAITVNSTSAQQALWRGLPVAALGRAVYRKPGLVSEQTLAGFMRHPRRPDLQSYWLLRRFMMETSQMPGSFYAGDGIDLALERLPAAMLTDTDAYDSVLARRARIEETQPRLRPTLIAAG